MDKNLFEKLMFGVPINGRNGLNFESFSKKLIKLSPFPKTTLGLTITAFGKFFLISLSPLFFEIAYLEFFVLSTFKADK